MFKDGHCTYTESFKDRDEIAIAEFSFPDFWAKVF